MCDAGMHGDWSRRSSFLAAILDRWPVMRSPPWPCLGLCRATYFFLLLSINRILGIIEKVEIPLSEMWVLLQIFYKFFQNIVRIMDSIETKKHRILRWMGLLRIKSASLEKSPGFEIKQKVEFKSPACLRFKIRMMQVLKFWEIQRKGYRPKFVNDTRGEDFFLLCAACTRYPRALHRQPTTLVPAHISKSRRGDQHVSTKVRDKPPTQASNSQALVKRLPYRRQPA